MGLYDPNFPTNVQSSTEAIAYLGAIVASMRAGLYTSITTANPTLTAAQMVGGSVDVSGQTTAQTVTTDTAANIIARMQALDTNAAVGSVASFTLINDNTSSGAVTLAGGSGVTITNGAALAIGVANRYRVVWSGANTVQLTRGG